MKSVQQRAVDSLCNTLVRIESPFLQNSTCSYREPDEPVVEHVGIHEKAQRRNILVHRMAGRAGRRPRQEPLRASTFHDPFSIRRSLRWLQRRTTAPAK